MRLPIVCCCHPHAGHHLYHRVHPFLPITDVVKALRACLFNAYEGHWATFLLRLLSIGIGALCLAWLLGRRHWKFVPDHEYGPAIDL